MTEVRFSGLSSLSFLDGRGTCSKSTKELYTEPQFSFGGFCTITNGDSVSTWGGESLDNDVPDFSQSGAISSAGPILWPSGAEDKRS
jgi:hypothetical protein